MIDHRPIQSGAFGNLPTRRPCVECPLRRDAKPGHLGGYTAEQYVDVLHGIADIACHLSPGFPHNRAEQRSCTGVAMYRANLRVWPLADNALAAVDHVGRDRAAVFDDPLAFIRHHRP
jgi:hypothetical protein